MDSKKQIKPLNHLTDMFYSQPHTARMLMTTRQVKETLLWTQNFIMACGRNWQLKVKNVGAGMKEVKLQPFE
jgi:hypothetical protein